MILYVMYKRVLEPFVCYSYVLECVATRFFILPTVLYFYSLLCRLTNKIVHTFSCLGAINAKQFAEGVERVFTPHPGPRGVMQRVSGLLKGVEPSNFQTHSGEMYSPDSTPLPRKLSPPLFSATRCCPSPTAFLQQITSCYWAIAGSIHGGPKCKPLANHQ